MMSDFALLDAMTPFPSVSQLGAGSHKLSIWSREAPRFFNVFGCRLTLVWTNQIGIPK